MITKEKFIDAMVAGGDFSRKTATEFYDNVIPEETPTHYLDLLLCSALKSESSESDLKYAIHQLQSALNTIEE